MRARVKIGRKFKFQITNYYFLYQVLFRIAFMNNATDKLLLQYWQFFTCYYYFKKFYFFTENYRTTLVVGWMGGWLSLCGGGGEGGSGLG